VEELEDMMIQEAVRQSLAAEEERQRKEEKAMLKDAKKREKEEQKRREKEEKKAAKKQGSNPYGHSTGGASGSSLSLSGFGRRRGNSATSNLRMETSAQGSSQVPSSGCSSPPSAEVKDTAENLPTDKGKAVDRGPATDSSTPEATSSSPGSLPIPMGRGRSHLRQMSNASSLGSSDDDCPSGSHSGLGSQDPEGTNPSSSCMRSGRQSPDGEGDTNSDPTVNFRSLAEVVGVDTDDGSAKHEEGPDSSGKAHTSTGRPLSQVEEDEMEEADAGHVEERKDADPITAPAIKAEATEEALEKREEELLPGLTTEPGVAALGTEDTAPGDKQLGHSRVAEQPSQVTP